MNNQMKLPGAEFSECGRHRYLLRLPTGLLNDRIALGIFANPSTATAEVLDPTMRRWRAYCRDWGYGWSWTANIEPTRETNPRLVVPAPPEMQARNSEWILAAAESADLVVCGWGQLGGPRGLGTLQALRSIGIVPHALKLNANGTPAHPLYLKARLRPKAMLVEQLEEED